MQKRSVTFTGTVSGLTITMKEDEDFNEIVNSISEKVTASGKFFKGSLLDVKYRGRILSKEEEEKILKLLTDIGGATIMSFKRDDEELCKVISNKGSMVKPKAKSKSQKKNSLEIEEVPSGFYKGTVRSGQLIKYDGNIVIIGDVNPGGEVVATGNVMVMGSLRGIVHAGSSGNKDSVVVAFNLNPTQLRIADVITRSPDENGTKNQLIPELAYVKEELVYIERYLPQR